MVPYIPQLLTSKKTQNFIMLFLFYPPQFSQCGEMFWGQARLEEGVCVVWIDKFDL